MLENGLIGPGVRLSVAGAVPLIVIAWITDTDVVAELEAEKTRVRRRAWSTAVPEPFQAKNVNE